MPKSGSSNAKKLSIASPIPKPKPVREKEAEAFIRGGPDSGPSTESAQEPWETLDPNASAQRKLTVRLNDYEYESLARIAKLQHRSLNKMLRFLISKAIEETREDDVLMTSK